MKYRWLGSKAISAVFFYAVVVFMCFCVITILMAIPSVRQILNSSAINHAFASLFFLMCAIAIPSVLIIYFGMMIFCVRWDRSSIGSKVLWFIFFLLAGPIGSTVYYFSVYRRVATISVNFPNHDEGATGPSQLGTGDDSMTRGA